jgi:sugar lactone lactonase YvrE
MTIAPDGDAFVSDSAGGRVYRLRAGTSALTPLDDDGQFISPQTPAVSPDGQVLIIPDYVRGLARIDLRSGSDGVEWIAGKSPVATSGVDGLYFADATTLIAVQNGTQPERVVRLHLDRGCREVVSFDIIEQASDWLGDPTHGVVAGDRFYFIAKSGWEHMNDDGSVKQGETPRGSLMLVAPTR